MRKFRTTEEVALARAMEGTRARRVGPQPPIPDEDQALQAALEGQCSFPTNAPEPPILSRIAALFGRGPEGIAGDGG